MIIFLLNLLKDGISAEQVDHHGQMVDDSSDPKDCIVCHDGLIAPEAHFCTVECGFGTSHSILKEYPPRMKESSYAPVESLQKKGIRLYNGKVSCVSCHDIKKTTQYHLVMDNSDSTLCFACHIT
jgi:predicted CXXCH cytochrome family protein